MTDFRYGFSLFAPLARSRCGATDLLLTALLSLQFPTDILTQGLPLVIPVQAGIQLGTGYFFVFEKVACPLSGARLAPRFRGGWPE
jgi:hypothetical protein